MPRCCRLPAASCRRSRRPRRRWPRRSWPTSATPRPVADLFAGIGTFSLRLARRGRRHRRRRRRRAARRARRGRAPRTRPEAGHARCAATCSSTRWRRTSSTRSARWSSIRRPPAPSAQSEALAAVARAEGRRGLVQPGDARPRRAHPDRRRLSPHAGAAGRSVPVVGRNRGRRLLRALTTAPRSPRS